MKLFLAPHNDDETLFGAFTLLREKPLVVVMTDSWRQWARGEQVTADDRWAETVKALEILGCAGLRVGIKDTESTPFNMVPALQMFTNVEQVFVPAFQHGNRDHDSLFQAAQEVFGDKCKHYTTYTPRELYTEGTEEVKPTPEELELKLKAMECYVSQNRINGPHFEAVKGRSEWFV